MKANTSQSNGDVSSRRTEKLEKTPLTSVSSEETVQSQND